MRADEIFPSLTAMFFSRAAELGDKPFLWTKHEGRWRYRKAGRRQREMSLRSPYRFVAQGVESGRPCDAGERKPAGILHRRSRDHGGGRGRPCPTYTTNTTRDHQHIITDSGACAVIFSTAKIAKALMPGARCARTCEFAISIEPVKTMQSGAVHVHEWEALIATHPGDRKRR